MTPWASLQRRGGGAPDAQRALMPAALHAVMAVAIPTKRLRCVGAKGRLQPNDARRALQFRAEHSNLAFISLWPDAQLPTGAPSVAQHLRLDAREGGRAAASDSWATVSKWSPRWPRGSRSGVIGVLLHRGGAFAKPRTKAGGLLFDCCLVGVCGLFVCCRVAVSLLASSCLGSSLSSALVRDAR